VDRVERNEGWSGRAAGWLRASTNLLVPPVCLLCRAPLDAHDALCARCWAGIVFIRAPRCDVLGIPLPFDAGPGAVSAAASAHPPEYNRARAVAQFTGSMRALIHRLKYADRHEGRKLLGRWMTDAAADLLPGTDVIVPVPLARWRLFGRKFNQASLLAHELGRLTCLSVDPMALVRRRSTPSQVGLTRVERRQNVAGAFAVPKARRSSLSGRTVLLVDDVVTTGATVNACARVLKRAGAERVDVVALALAADFTAPSL
jgi:ComF family protein